MLLNIANIQHFSVGDGHGIRTTVFFKGCNLRCPWCHNPETISFGKTRLDYPHLNKTEWCGKEMSPEDVLKELLEDRDFYTESGGGVTFSGGEVMLSADGACVLAKMLRDENISVLCDTAGNVPYTEFQKMNPFVDGYLYDFKTASCEKFSKVIGGDLNTVTVNLTRLLKDGINVFIRIPLIPDFNTDEESVEEMCRSLSDIGIKEVFLLPFHRTGSGKYEAMGKDYAYKDVGPLDGATLDRIKKRFLIDFKVNIEA